MTKVIRWFGTHRIHIGFWQDYHSEVIDGTTHITDEHGFGIKWEKVDR